MSSLFAILRCRVLTEAALRLCIPLHRLLSLRTHLPRKNLGAKHCHGSVCVRLVKRIDILRAEFRRRGQRPDHVLGIPGLCRAGIPADLRCLSLVLGQLDGCVGNESETHESGRVESASSHWNRDGHRGLVLCNCCDDILRSARVLSTGSREGSCFLPGVASSEDHYRMFNPFQG